MHVARQRPARLVLQQLPVRGEDAPRLVAAQPVLLRSARRTAALHHVHQVREAPADRIAGLHALESLAHAAQLEVARRDGAEIVLHPEVEQLQRGVAGRERLPARCVLLAVGQRLEESEVGQRAS